MLRDYVHSLLGIEEGLSDRNYKYGQFYLIRDSKPLIDQLPRYVPLRAGEYRILHALSGRAVFEMNMEKFTLEKGSVMITPPNSIGFFADYYYGFSAEILILPQYFSELARRSRCLLPAVVFKLQLSEKDELRIGKVIDLLEEYMRIGLASNSKNPFTKDCIDHLLLSLTSDLCQINGIQTASNTHYSKQGQYFGQFMQLLNQYGSKERSLNFYAEKMNLSRNQLNAIILEQSGKSVMDWIYQTTIMEAKMLLSHTDLLIFEIAAQLQFSEPSAFIRFFRKQTGMSPGAYRKENMHLED